MRREKKEKPADTKPADRNINRHDEINTSVEIPTYAPNQTLVPKEYMMANKLSELESTIEKKCLEYFEKVGPKGLDPYNSSYMDSVIENAVMEALAQIDIQRADHIHSIIKSLDDLHQGDKIVCLNNLQHYKDELEEVEMNLERCNKVFYRGTSFEEYYE